MTWVRSNRVHPPVRVGVAHDRAVPERVVVVLDPGFDPALGRCVQEDGSLVAGVR